MKYKPKLVPTVYRYTPLFTYDFFDKWFTDTDAVGMEFEYSTDVADKPTPPRTVSTLRDYGKYLTYSLYRYDGSGAHEISLPSCSMATEESAVRCAEVHTLFIDLMDLPVEDQSRRCGRHIHVTRPDMHLDYIIDRLYSEYHTLLAVFSISIPFSSGYILNSGEVIRFRLRNYAAKYAKLTTDFTTHHNFISVSSRWNTLEIRWPELTTITFIPFAWVIRDVIYHGRRSELANSLISAVAQLPDTAYRKTGDYEVGVKPEFFDAVSDVFASHGYRLFAGIVDKWRDVVLDNLSKSGGKLFVSNKMLTELVREETFNELRSDLKSMLSGEVKLYKTHDIFVLSGIAYKVDEKLYIPDCYYCYDRSLTSYVYNDVYVTATFNELVNTFIAQCINVSSCPNTYTLR
jgi:hypothetical protein